MSHVPRYASWYTSSMTGPTTIKVSSEVRDRLKTQANAAGRTLGDHLRHLADLGDRAGRFEALRIAIEATPAESLASYERETTEWDSLERD